MWLTNRMICAFVGHRPIKKVVKWKTWFHSNKKNKFTHRKHRKSWIECERCGMVFKDETYDKKDFQAKPLYTG